MTIELTFEGGVHLLLPDRRLACGAPMTSRAGTAASADPEHVTCPACRRHLDGQEA